MRAGISDNLHGDGHLTSIGARFESRKCPHLPGETAAKLLHATRRDARERPLSNEWFRGSEAWHGDRGGPLYCLGATHSVPRQPCGPTASQSFALRETC